MKRPILIVFIVLLIAALAALNNQMSNIASKAPTDEDESAAAVAQSKSASGTKPPPAIPPMTPRVLVPHVNIYANLPTAPEDLTINDPKTAKHTIKIGYTYDPYTEINVSFLLEAIQTAKNIATSSHGNVSLQVVDLDIPAAARSASTQAIADVGISIDGRQTFNVNGKSVNLTDNPGEGSTTNKMLVKVLRANGIK